MIVGTAGHVDHGKTALVKALTGIDTDRLPDEKRRGLSIDLGFAYRPIANGRVLGFVDVPGHERFIRNMLAGVTGIDRALVVVAADDGPMPQTIEHLAILDLLGVSDGVVALTKIDRVDRDRIDALSAQLETLLSGTSLAGAPIVAVSAVSGAGIPELRARLEATARRAAERQSSGHFRLAIDRAFTLPGVGLIVTGMVFSGAVRAGDRLVLSPSGIPVRVRGIHAQNREATEAGAGQRAALNISGRGVRKEDARRGGWLLAEPVHAPTRHLDVRLRLLRSEGRRLEHWTPAHVHLGAAALGGRIALLQRRGVEPGAEALAQLVLERPIGALRGDRFILRDQSARRTIAGGRVVDPFAPARGRAKPERIAYLRAMERSDAKAALTEVLDHAPGGVDLGRFARARNLTPDAMEALVAGVPMVRIGAKEAPTAVSARRWGALSRQVLDAVDGRGEDRPHGRGLKEQVFRRTMRERVPMSVLDAVIADLIGDGKLARGGPLLHRPERVLELTSADASLWARVRPLLEGNGRRPPAVGEIAVALALETRSVERFLFRARRMGLVVRVAENRFFTPEAILRLAQAVEALAAPESGGVFAASAFRDRCGIGRNLSIQVLEFFDAEGFTHRVGKTRRVLRPALEVFRPGIS